MLGGVVSEKDKQIEARLCSHGARPDARRRGNRKRQMAGLDLCKSSLGMFCQQGLG